MVQQNNFQSQFLKNVTIVFEAGLTLTSIEFTCTQLSAWSCIQICRKSSFKPNLAFHIKICRQISAPIISVNLAPVVPKSI